jgi:prepilin peptidase CpaA
VILAWAAVIVFLAAAGRDLGWRIIDHRIVVSLLLLWGGHAALSGWSWQLTLSHLAVGVGAFIVGALLYRFGAMAGGDVKLALAVFVWAGPDHGIGVFEIVAIAGGVIAVLGIAARLLARLPLPVWTTRGLGLISTERGVPYGVALALGGAAAALSAPVGMG